MGFTVKTEAGLCFSRCKWGARLVLPQSELSRSHEALCIASLTQNTSVPWALTTTHIPPPPFSTFRGVQIAFWESYFCSPCSLNLSLNWHYRKQSRKKLPLGRAQNIITVSKKNFFRYLSNRQEHRKNSTLVGLNIFSYMETHISIGPSLEKHEWW